MMIELFNKLLDDRIRSLTRILRVFMKYNLEIRIDYATNNLTILTKLEFKNSVSVRLIFNESFGTHPRRGSPCAYISR